MRGLHEVKVWWWWRNLGSEGVEMERQFSQSPRKRLPIKCWIVGFLLLPLNSLCQMEIIRCQLACTMQGTRFACMGWGLNWGTLQPFSSGCCKIWDKVVVCKKGENELCIILSIFGKWYFDTIEGVTYIWHSYLSNGFHLQRERMRSFVWLTWCSFVVFQGFIYLIAIGKGSINLRGKTKSSPHFTHS